ncbi:MAG: 7-cyano-7-deazaguanine synthase QueC [Pseudomonadales bacterium]|nr:7-cyano-7-deazaguanine synthase QueC [Pseudomonadales bacterium]
MGKKAVVLLSGGLDSATTLVLAQSEGFSCYALSFDYGQRNRTELHAAENIAAHFHVEHKILRIGLDGIGGSALTDQTIDMPQQLEDGIPVTYVPARNTVFLSLALGWAEVLEADDIFIGVNAVDYSGYPDCRPEFIEAFERMANLATKAASDGRVIRIRTPLINLSKGQIIEQGMAHGLDYSMSVSCYAADTEGRACGTCDSCRLRSKGFLDAGFDDPTYYQ